MSFSKANTDRLPSFLGGGMDWHIQTNEKRKSNQPLQEFTKKPLLITSFLGYRSSKSKRSVAKVSSNEAVSVESRALSSGQNLSASVFVPQTLEN